MRDLINIDGALFFVASPPGESLTLMRSNGTEEGTVVIKPGLDGVVDLVDMDGTVCFAAAGGELWKSNGTEYGTELIKDIHPDDLIIKRILTITRVNSRVFFSGDDGIHGHELWISDGTCDGTKLVKDILPGNMGSSPDVRNMYAADNILLFKPDDGIDGRELWRSDGTCEGTYMVQDLYPGSVSSEPNEIIRIGDKVYISARDVSKGFELWSGKLKKKSYFGKGADSDITDEIQEAPIKTGLYPNPVRENATLSVYATRQGKTSYSIIDQNGKTVQTKSIILNEGNNIISIETRSFSSGVYSIVLNNGGRMEQVRFIKQ
jgi:ELWxxDGT repeat protein